VNSNLNDPARRLGDNRPAPDAEIQLDMYRRMSLIKQNDEETRRVIRAGKIQAPYYSPRGQEVIPSAIAVNLDDDDYVCTTYRGTHDMLAKGVSLRTLWSEMAGKVTGACKGKGGPMHITDARANVLLTTGIVGSTMPVANGLAWSSQLRKDGRVTVANFGDGATNIGAFHEALNLAGLWRLPIVFVCQNNRYAEHTRMENCTAVDRISNRAASYSMPGIHVDGNDPIAMYGAAREAIGRARSGNGPSLIDAQTFRFFGHVFGDDDAYMRPSEREDAMAADPVIAFRQRLIEAQITDEAALAAIEAEIADQIRDAVDYALSSPPPPIEELVTDVFAIEEVQ
jgi:pyruvate dehydrogenase E1 component alpha subunit